MSQTCEEVEFQLSTIKLAAKRWNRGAKHRVIALHGWLDNAGTFDMLLPYLNHLDCVALDMAGHGQSEYRSADSSYNIWKDTPEILEVTQQLGWDTFSVMGHSRGAMISTVFAGTFPEKIENIVLIDAIAPHAIEPSEVPKQLASAIDSVALLARRKSTMFASYDEAAQARTSGRFPLSVEASRVLAERSVVEGEEGYYWRYDPWLLLPSELKFSEDQSQAFVDRFPRPACAILASEGVLPDETRPAWMDSHENLDIIFMEGEHHLQLAANAKCIEALARVIYDAFEPD